MPSLAVLVRRGSLSHRSPVSRLSGGRTTDRRGKTHAPYTWIPRPDLPCCEKCAPRVCKSAKAGVDACMHAPTTVQPRPSAALTCMAQRRQAGAACVHVTSLYVVRALRVQARWLLHAPYVRATSVSQYVLARAAFRRDPGIYYFSLPRPVDPSCHRMRWTDAMERGLGWRWPPATRS